MNTTLYSKLDIALIIMNQFSLTEPLRFKMAQKLIRLAENLFYAEALIAGIHYEYFGHNKYQIK